MGSSDDRGKARAARSAARRRREPPLATATHQRELFARLLDPEHMLEVFRRELPAWTETPIQVTRCSLKPAKTARSRKAIKEGRMLVVYTLGIEVGGEGERELVLLASAPAAPESLAALEQRAAGFREHPSVFPFRRLAAHLPALEAVVFVSLLDPALPALAEVTGADAGPLLAPHLSECRRGARIQRMVSELRHYKPLHRAVLRMTAELDAPSGASARSFYVKLFADERGAASHRDLERLWSVARHASHLRVPEPLGYDLRCRMLVMGEAPGARALSDWIRCLEHEEGLPAATRERLERCLVVVVHALRELQRSGLCATERRTFRDELERLRKDGELLLQDGEGRTESKRAVEHLLRRLESLTPVAETLVPAHGGLRHKQTVGDERTLTFIDWDGFCMASPALDAATFLVRLRQEPSSHPGAAPELERLAERFREELHGVLPEAFAHLALYEGLGMTEQVLRSFRRAARGEALAVAKNLARSAQALLERAETGA